MRKSLEEKYQYYKGEESRIKYEELKAKKERRSISSEELKEYNKMEKIYENLFKVDNIKEYIEKLEDELEILKEEFKNREQNEKNEQVLSDNSNQTETLETEINENLKKQDELISKRRDTNRKIDELQAKRRANKGELSAEDNAKLSSLLDEKVKINSDLTSLKEDAQKNNINLIVRNNASKSVKSTPAQLNPALKKYSKEELRKKCFDISTQISKCNLVASNLMKGLNRENIQLKLEGFKDKTYTSKYTPLPLKEAEKKKEQGQENQSETIEKNNIQNINVSSKKTEQTLPVKVSDFQKAFPKLAKKFPNLENNFIGKTLLKIKNTFSKEEIGDNVDKKEELNETSEISNQSTKQQKFRDYMKYDILEVADKGIETVEEEHKKEARKRYEAKREEAYKKQDEKFGKGYSNQSRQVNTSKEEKER